MRETYRWFFKTMKESFTRFKWGYIFSGVLIVIAIMMAVLH